MSNSADKHRYLKALRRAPVDKTPVWVMRQAGRYLPEYRAIREKAGDFLTLCKSPDLACEVTLQPLRRFDLDAAILFSDILTIPDAQGLGLSLNEGIGPRFEHPVRSRAEVLALPQVDVETDLSYVLDAVRLIRTELNGHTPLIGFSGSPWTLATYMVEGGSSKDFKYVKGMMHGEPDTAHALLQKITAAVIDYLHSQVEAGVQSLMIFDTWGGVLSTPDYQNFSLQYMAEIVSRLKADSRTADIPVTLFTKGGGQWLEMIAATGCDCIGVDWTTPLHSARERVGHLVALQGNMDPTVLYAGREKVISEVRRVKADFGDGPGHIFNLGHGIHPGIQPDRMNDMVEAVHRQF
ncbi:MAG: uroporphyrinogen decarboxylase [Pseudomonadota bacterium]